MLSLTLEERGAYNTCLDLIYDREGPIPDDSRWLAGWMGVSARKWATIRASLIDKAKLFALVVNGVPSLMNQRAATELENQSKRARELSENGAKGGRRAAETKAKANENNAPPQAPVKLSTVTVTEQKNPITSNEVISPLPDKTKGSRLPENWFPLPTLVGEDLCLPGDQWSAELEKFRDYWRAVPGAKGRKLDWDATWRNWLRRASENLQTRKAHGQSNTPADKRTAREANHARAFHGSLRASGLVGEP